MPWRWSHKGRPTPIRRFRAVVDESPEGRGLKRSTPPASQPGRSPLPPRAEASSNASFPTYARARTTRSSSTTEKTRPCSARFLLFGAYTFRRASSRARGVRPFTAPAFQSAGSSARAPRRHVHRGRDMGCCALIGLDSPRRPRRQRHRSDAPSPPSFRPRRASWLRRRSRSSPLSPLTASRTTFAPSSPPVPERSIAAHPRRRLQILSAPPNYFGFLLARVLHLEAQDDLG